MHLQDILILIAIPVTIIICNLLDIFVKNRKYKKSTYYQITKLSYNSVKHDTGRYGEYLIYKRLKNFEECGAKFLFNLYIPKSDGGSSEIDILMICSKGIFVFESKNYSGWIFGSEHQKNWYQTLPAGRGRSHKEHFYNPIMQNNAHIKHLKALLEKPMPIQSIIVFSDRCTLKDIQINNHDIHVIHRCDSARIITGICDQIPANVLNENEIFDLYNKLYPHTQVDSEAKKKHIENIQSHLNPPAYSSNASPMPEKPVENTLTTESQTETELLSADNIVESTGVTTKETADNAIMSYPVALETKELQIIKCPRCGGNLILRTATRGENIGKQFYGCSSYPKCKYIQTIPVSTE